MADYLKYIPQIFSNHTTNAIALTFIPGLFYVLAAFGHLMVAGSGLAISIVVSVIFAAIEYVFRVPITKYSSNEAGMSNGTIQTIWVVITLILSKISEFLM